MYFFHSPAMVRGIFAGLDCDRDGVVTLPDLVTWFNTVLNRRETNKEDHAVKAAVSGHILDPSLDAVCCVRVCNYHPLTPPSPVRRPQLPGLPKKES